MLTQSFFPPEVLRYWGFARDPFSREISGAADILELKETSHAEQKIHTAVDRGGWLVITGAVGSGKTLLRKRIEEHLRPRRDVVLVSPRLVEKQYLGAGHVCEAIIQDLGDGRLSSRGSLELKARHVGRLLEDAFRGGRKVLLLIDEAHLLRPSALLALKRITELDEGLRNPLAIVLIGQPALARLLRTNYTLSEVAQRVELSEIPPMHGTLPAYLRQKLTRAGCAEETDLFSAGALTAMSERADTPLAVNNLAAAALLAAWQLGEQQVSARTIHGL